MWLLRRDVAARFERWLEAGIKPSDAQLAKFLERRQGPEAGPHSQPLCLTIAGDVAQICVEGVLTPQPDFWAWLFYGANTSYAEIREALGVAATNPAVKRVEFHVDSPGGMVAGLFECLGAIEAFDPSKKRTVKAALACSAAYAIAAVVGTIEATSIAAEFGSIGVAQTFVRYADTQIIDITSTEAPDKRPDPTTPEGQAVIRRELDAIHEIFVDAIARGRTSAGTETKPDQVNAEYGRGAVFLAREAASRGMIDKAPKPPRAVKRAETETGEPEAAPPNATPSAAPQEEHRTMTLEQLKAQHPELYKKIVDDAVAMERDRVSAHLIRGQASGAMTLAVEAIEAGHPMTETYRAKYDAAAGTRKEQSDRQTESDEVGATVKGAKTVSTGDEGEADLGDQVAAVMSKERGKKKTAA
ncbi:MAG TPA: S49 family peptidase [Polyangiaceae bacterium]